VYEQGWSACAVLVASAAPPALMATATANAAVIRRFDEMNFDTTCLLRCDRAARGGPLTQVGAPPSGMRDTYLC
jgi:hypothetical protein